MVQSQNRNLDTELSNKFWKVKDSNRSASKTWEILGSHQAYNTNIKRKTESSIAQKQQYAK